MSTDKWLAKSLKALEQENWYDALESFQGTFFRAIKQKRFEEGQDLFRRAITEFEKHPIDEVFFRKLAEYFLQLTIKIAGRMLIESEAYLPAIEILTLVVQRSDGDVRDFQEAIAVAYEKLSQITEIEEEEIEYLEYAGLNYLFTNVDKGRQIYNRLATGGDTKHGCYTVMAALVADDITECDAILKGMGKAKGFMGKRKLGTDPYYSFAEQVKDLYISQDTMAYLTLIDEYRQLLTQDKILDRLSKILRKKFPKIEPQGFPGFPGMPFGGGFDFPPSG
jgi:hypothetical protein